MLTVVPFFPFVHWFSKNVPFRLHNKLVMGLDTPEALRFVLAEEAMQGASGAFEKYRLEPLVRRTQLLRAIATELEDMGDEWIQTAQKETNLTAERLIAERRRTIYQLESYGMACAQGDWMRISIDTSDLNNDDPVGSGGCFWSQ
jgi:acyl-CoA reductase-like NAD-dependent aldehyde dehydrogenase